MAVKNNSRWVAGTDGNSGKLLPFDPKVEAFLDEIVVVCKKHGMSLAHEDIHGGFAICNYHPKLERWLRAAMDARPRMPEEFLES